MKRFAKRFAAVGLAAGCFMVGAAHVGSPNVFFNGPAGPYAIRVIVRPPMVVPGRAEVIVRAADSDVRAVSIRPVFWRAGVKGAPEGDPAVPVAGVPGTFSGLLWLMQRGAYSVYVTVDGARGTGTAIVPVLSVATGRLGISSGLMAILVVLGAALVAGLITLVRAGAGEGLLPPGEVLDARGRRRANIIAAVTVPILAVALFGGAKWWTAVDEDYQRTMYRPPTPSLSVQEDRGRLYLTLSTVDPRPDRMILAPLLPDHGKMMHLFLIGGTGQENFAHLHPLQIDTTTFRVELPALPAGAYTAFADVTTETGTSYTLTNTVDIPASAAGRGTPSATADSDDAWSIGDRPVHIAAGAADTLPGGVIMRWAEATSPPRAGEAVDLHFAAVDAKGAPFFPEPYMGMAGHAVVVRDDDSVFVHLHPMGSISPAAQNAFVLRENGDTTARGRLLLDKTAPPMAHEMPFDVSLVFPYEFPKPGHYRIWVQVRHQGKVLTAAFDIDVAP